MSPRQSNDSLGRPVAPKRRPEKEINMNANTKPVAAEPKAAVTLESRKVRPRASRPAAKAEKLVCRYCGSQRI
jgi:hypothetical protein